MFAVYTLALFFFILHEHSGCVNSAVTWSACDSSVLAQFKSFFPDYVPPASGRRRAETGSMRSESNGNGFDRSNHEIFKMFKTKSSPWVLNDKMAKPREGENRLFALNHYLYEEESKDDKDGTTRKIKFKSHNPRFSLFNNKPPFVKDRRKLATTPCTDCSLGCCTVSDIELRCGIVPVPKSYPAASPTMDIRVYHIRVIGAAAPTDAANRKHLWLLQGGPGGSGASLMFLALSAMQYATDVYIPDHRGTGDSSSLECPGQETSISSGGSDITSTEVQPCYNYCLQLNQNWDDFTTTNAAKDLNEVIVAVYNDATVKPKSTTVHGYSYGTRWLSRYLQVFPNVGNIVTNIILEGNVMNETVFNDFPLGMQSVGDRLLDKCALETTCSEKIKSITSPTSTPKQAFQEMIDDILAGATSTTTNKCTIVIGGSQPNKADTLAYIQQLLQSGITYGIQYAGDKNEIAIDFRAITISMIYRWYKCKTQPDVHLKPFTFMVVFMIHIGGGSLGGLSIDKNVLNKVKEDIDRPTLLDVDEVESNVLYYLIRYSELWRYPMPSQSQYSATFDKVVFGYVDDFTYLKSVAETYLQGYVYPKDAYVTGLTAQNVAANVLIINGELDGQTPYKDAQTQFQRTSTASGKEKILAVIPNGGHGTTDHGCGEEVLRLFSNGQYAEAKTKISQCALQNTVPTLGTWDLDAKYSKVISGSEKMWDGSIDGSTCKSFSLPSGSTCYNPSGTFSSSVISQCIQCFDYCLLAASGNNEDLCTCVADLRACTNTALCSQSQEVCEQVRDIYAKQLFTGATVTQFSKCPCVASISQTAVIGIAVGVAAAALVIGAVIFFVVRRRRNNTQSFQNMQQRV